MPCPWKFAGQRWRRNHAAKTCRKRGNDNGEGAAFRRFRSSILRRSKRISVGDYPEGIETSADCNRVYVVNWFSHEVWAINTETLAVTAKMPVGDGPRAFGTFLRETP